MNNQDTDTSEDRHRRNVLVARLASFEDDYADGAITGAQLAKATATVSAELEEIDARLAVSLRQDASSPIVNAVDPGQAFLEAPLDVQRAILATVIKVEVLPQSKRGAAWSSERLRIELAV